MAKVDEKFRKKSVRFKKDDYDYEPDYVQGSERVRQDRRVKAKNKRNSRYVSERTGQHDEYDDE